ncbi:Tyrosyl-DNA phosphodiesterase 1 [Fusarium subglutinans]|uniref:Tyrosyl-DNA phosphodiesterase 1 n=1 Tax=Gibberella subglutinans TaxID=42677 RepID=A0A8H5VAN2_GIBSU|nr:Tyrosyl-DNA phosphodiesterase 1 [Fusarium subglutinans]KAF5614329.1 Tyrosyl-DNA phosphodiesterase 1 [Fusarium subglutinans]
MAGSREDPVELGSDMDEDEALRYAIALSLQEQEEQGDQSSQIPSASTSTSHRNGTGSGGASLGLLSLDRKKMEEERLQRLAKRRRSPEDERSVDEVPPAKKMTPSEPSRPVTATATAHVLPSLVPYPKGAIKRTWAKGYPRTSDDIKIEEVFQKDKLELALLSSYQWDDEWLMSKIDPRKTKLLLLAFADSEAQKSEMLSNAPPGIKFVFPAMNGPGAMHSKLQLLKYPDYLRVVVPTANLVPYDWGETGVMENMVFLIDLPRLEDPATYRQTAFSTELGRFLSATGAGEGMVSSLANYDFSQTKHLGFVYTIPGGHQGDSSKRIGYSGLGTTVAALGLATDEPIDVDFVRWAPDAQQDDHGITDASGKPAAAEPKTEEMSLGWVYIGSANLSESAWGRIVKDRATGQPKMSCRNWESGVVVRISNPKNSSTVSASFSTSASASAGASSSTKVKAAEGQAQSSVRAGKISAEPDKGCDTSQHNHHHYQMQKQNRKHKQEEGLTDTDAHADSDMMSGAVFEGTVPIPMRRPGRRYREGEEPWFYSVQG